MRWNNVAIESLSYVLPGNVIKSSDLELAIEPILKRLGLPPGQIEKLAGVRERRWWDPGVQPSVPATLAGKMALDQAGLGVEAVDALINTSVSRDYLEPATAALIGGRLGVPRKAFCYDVTNACVGFLNGLISAANLIELGQIETALVVNAECVREGVTATTKRLSAPDANADTFRDNFASLTLGDAAVGCVLRRRDPSRKQHLLNGAVVRTATEHNQLCLGSEHQMVSNAHGLLVHGVGLAVETWPFAAKEMGWASPHQIDQFICHQVSVAHFTQSFEQMGFPLDRAPLTLPYLGNCGPVSTPITLALSVAQGRVKDGDELCLFGVGSGLSCIIMGVTW
jgi:3-oxoacyl-[acyl-carrier-protein] synthase-3